MQIAETFPKPVKFVSHVFKIKKGNTSIKKIYPNQTQALNSPQSVPINGASQQKLMLKDSLSL